MACSSFRQPERPRWIEYRTPSPPLHAIEFITPSATAPRLDYAPPLLARPAGHFSNAPLSSKQISRPRQNHSGSNGSGLEAFASIALATTRTPVDGAFDGILRKRGAIENGAAEDETHASKRVKKSGYEVFGRPTSTNELPTPVSAVDPSSSQKQEAELLLNFSREAHEEHQRSTSLVSSDKYLSPTFSSRPFTSYQPVFDESPKQANLKIESDFRNRQEPEHKTDWQIACKGTEEANASESGDISVQCIERQGFDDAAPVPQPQEQRSTPPHDKSFSIVVDLEPKASVNDTENTDIRPRLEVASGTLSNDNELPEATANVSTEQSSAPGTHLNGFLEGIEEAANSAPLSIRKGASSSSEHDGSTSSPTKMSRAALPSVCAACNFTPDSLNLESPDKWTHWINCDACKDWFHFACAGFRSERETRAVDKFRCKKCEKQHGQKTSYTRKSNRTHSQIDYAGLNEGILKTSDAVAEHHYVKHFKSGHISFQQENFPRMRPEDATAEFFGRGDGMKGPVVIPAEWNPRPPPRPQKDQASKHDQGLPQNQAPPQDQCSHQNLAPPQEQAKPQEQVQPQDQAPVQQHAPRLDQATLPNLAAPQDQVSLQDQAPRKEQASFQDSPHHEQALHNEQALRQKQVPYPEQAPQSESTGQDSAPQSIPTQLPEAPPINAAPPKLTMEDPDGMDMVMPRDLTVRQVAELYGPEEKVEVIDVKSQNGEDKRWNMRRWADYYESTTRKVIHNVISLEVSHSELGQLVQRPKIVQDLDLQDDVWPDELKAKGEFPKVQMYCLMSVADCFTDFHIDFGGSSVFYHILKGKKTFFFIPPLDKHLKKYEQWCNSQAQNFTFLGQQTNECYRVDLLEGDTMLIPAGWIHAVWTPEDSLVIGGNFLTRMHYPLQIRVAQIEKATHVARKFRYPYFQKLLWYAALRYLDDDPLPDSVKALLSAGQPFPRERPTWIDSDVLHENCTPTREYFNKRFYPKAELEGLPALGSYLLRTVRIVMNCINESITTEARNAVKRSIPKGHGHGEPLEAVKKFAMWYTWKLGNIKIPEWAFPDFVPEATAPEFNEKKPSARMQKKLEREAAYEAFKVAPERQSMRAKSQPQTLLAELAAKQATTESPKKSSPVPQPPVNGSAKRKAEGPLATETPKKKRASTVEGKGSSPRQRACEACRKARRGCKHRDAPRPSTPPKNHDAEGQTVLNTVAPSTASGKDAKPGDHISPTKTSPGQLLRVEVPFKKLPPLTGDTILAGVKPAQAKQLPNGSSASAAKPNSRAKACEICRKSKVGYSPSLLCALPSDCLSDAASMTSMATRIPLRSRRRRFHGPRRRSVALRTARNLPTLRRLRWRLLRLILQILKCLPNRQRQGMASH